MSTRPGSVVVPLKPPRLMARLEYYKAKLPPFAPQFDRVFVYPIDTADQPTATAAGIILADVTKERANAQRGLLIMAGAKGVEELYSHGIGIGDIVITARLSPWSRMWLDPEGRQHRVLILTAGDITASEDLATAYDKGDFWMELDPEGRVHICDRDDARDRNDPPSVQGV